MPQAVVTLAWPLCGQWDLPRSHWHDMGTDTGSLSCSLWAQGVPVPRHWGQPEALLCAQSPPKAQTAFLLGVVSPPLTVWHEPKLPAWGQAPDPGEDAATKNHHGHNRAPVTPAECGWGGHARGTVGSSALPEVYWAPSSHWPPQHCSPHPRGGITRGNCWHRHNCSDNC